MLVTELNYLRYVNDKKITSKSKHKISSEKVDEYRTVYRLTVEDCEQSDQGKYKIVAENTAGKSDDTANLKLYSTYYNLI